MRIYLPIPLTIFKNRLSKYFKASLPASVVINNYHTKRAKELDDYSPTKDDKKDTLTVTRLTRITTCHMMTILNLRVLSNTRTSLMRRHNTLKNTIRAVLDEYFPELITVFKCLLKGKACRSPEDLSLPLLHT